MNMYKCIIVEDEPLAQIVLKKYIEDTPTLKLVAVCNDAIEAQSALEVEAVQIIFLDINLPKLSGINFIKTLVQPPLIIFTTAYPQYAIEGFEVNAADYLLKPISFERFLKAVNKALAIVSAERLAPNNLLVSEPVFLKADKKNYKVNSTDILYIEAVDDYIKVFTTQGPLLIKETMKNMMEVLPVGQFIRVHKSYIIGVNQINYFEGNYVQVADRNIPIGATYRDEVSARFNFYKY